VHYATMAVRKHLNISSLNVSLLNPARHIFILFGTSPCQF
jgi:hypothetical protein